MAGRVLASLPGMFGDASPAVQGAALLAAAHCARVASLKAFQAYTATLAAMYWDKGADDAQARTAAALGLRTLVQVLSASEDVVRLDDVAAVVYVGRFDVVDAVTKHMKHVWDEVFALQGGEREHFQVCIDSFQKMACHYAQENHTLHLSKHGEI